MAEGYVSRFGHQQIATAERASLPGAFDGQVIFNTDRRNIEVYDETDGIWLSDKQARAVNNSGFTLQVGQPVIGSPASPDGVTLSSTESEVAIVGVVVDGDLSPGGVLTIATSGDWPVLTSGAVTVGDVLAHSSSTGVASSLAAGGAQGAFAVAKENALGPGPALVKASLQLTNRADLRPAYSPRAPTQVTLTSSSGQAYIQSTSATYEVLAQFAWPGTTDMSLPFEILAALSMNGGDSMDIRIFDATNTQTIAELIGYTTPVFTVVSLGTVSNVPATPAIWEIQVRGVGQGRKARAASVVFLPPAA